MPEYPVDIPAAAREVKAHYPTRPSDELVREIKQFIVSTGTPHLWPGHTHTRPPQGAVVVYRGEFDLPKSHAGAIHRAKWAPCPCCHADTAWYWQKGKIAWFPEESVIRNIGRDCFKNINEAGHEAAVQEFQREERNRQNQTFLLMHLAVVPEAVRIIERAMITVRDVDTARRILSTRLKSIISFDIWNDVRADGLLKIHGQRAEHFVRPDGTSDSRTVGVIQPYGSLGGYVMLNPDADPLAPKLERELAKLRLIDFGENFNARLEAMDEQARQRAANSLAKPIATAKEVFTATDECRRFLSAESIATLNGWGGHDQNPVRIYLELEPGALLIGRTQNQTRPMKLGDAFFSVFGELPRIGNIREA
jgi:hypothetical protein